MSFPRYPKYRDSGVEWLGKVPEHWSVSRISRLTRSGMGQTILRDMLEAEPSIETLPVYSASEGDDVFGYFANPTVRLAPGDLIVGARGSIGMTRRVISPATCTQTTIWIKLSDESVDSAFLFWCLTGGREGLFPFDKTAIPMLTVEQVRSGGVPIPPIAEQTKIAAFLDRETGKIDELVAEQRRLMELLKEKRQAVISHAVTKGLYPHAPMKPSGIEWLGDVPEGWTTPALYMRYSTELGKMLDSAKITGNHLIPYMRNVDVQWGSINFEDLPSMDICESDYERYTVKCGDLLVCEGGEVGRAAIVPPIAEIFGYQKALHRLRALHSSEDSTFMFFTLLWAANTGIFNQGGTSTIAHLTGEQLRKYRFPKPPISEQKAIVAFLDTETAKFDTLTAEAQRAIDLLQERRTALISAAVTGQIDVRPLMERKVA